MAKINNKKIWRVITIILMLVILLYLLVWTGTIRCSKIPGMCSIYWGFQTMMSGKKQPSILIAYNPQDDDSLGNPYLLEKTIKDNKIIGMNVRLENINYLSEEKLKGEALVIVTKSRKISTPKLEMFMNYVIKGGRLIWIGDAGIETEVNSDILLTKGDIDGTNDSNTISGWARLNSENYMIRFDEFLGVNYLSNYCDIKECEDKKYKIGNSNLEMGFKRPKTNNGVLVPSSDHRMVYGLKNYLEVKDNFSIVEVQKPMTIPLKIDYGSKMYIDKEHSIGDQNIFPVIVLSNSNRVAYYALPPEYLIEDDDPAKYYSIIENMLYGMLR